MEDKIKKIYKVVTETPKLKDAFTGITEDQFRTALQDEKAQDALYDDLVAYDLVTKGDPNEFWTNKGLRQPKVATPPVPQPPAVSLAPPQRQSIEQQAAGQATGFVPPMVEQPEQPMQPDLGAKSGGLNLGRAFGGVAPVFQDEAQIKQEAQSPVFLANELAAQNIEGAAVSPTQQAVSASQRDFAKMSPEQQAQAIAGSTGGELERKKANEKRSGLQKIKDFGKTLGGIATNAYDAIIASEKLLGAKQRDLLTFGGAEENLKKVKQQVISSMGKIENEYAQELRDNNIETSLVDVINKGELSKLPEAIGYNVANAIVSGLGAAFTGGYSMFAQTLAQDYKSGVENLAKETNRTPEQVIADGDDAELIPAISATIQGLIEKAQIGLASKAINSKGAYKYIRDLVVKNTGNSKWAKAAGAGLGLGVASLESGAQGAAQEVASIASEEAAGSDSFNKFYNKLGKTLSSEAGQKRLTESLVGEAIGAGGLIAGGRFGSRILGERSPSAPPTQPPSTPPTQLGGIPTIPAPPNAPEFVPPVPPPSGADQTTYETVTPEELQAFRQGQIDPERAAAIADDVALIQSGQMDINSIDDPNYRLMVESAMAPQKPAVAAETEIAPIQETQTIQIQPLNIDFQKNEGRNVNYQGIEGRIKIDSDGTPYVFTKDGEVVYIEGGLSGQTPQQLGIQPLADDVVNEADIETVLQDENAPLDQGQLEYDFDNNQLTLYGRPFTYDGVETNDKGQTTALRLIDQNGKTKFIRNQDVILEFEIQKEIYEKQPTVESIQQAATELQAKPAERGQPATTTVQQGGPVENIEGVAEVANEQLPLANQAAQNMGTAVNQPLETGAAAVEVGESGRPVVEVEGDQVVEEEKPVEGYDFAKMFEPLTKEEQEKIDKENLQDEANEKQRLFDKAGFDKSWAKDYDEAKTKLIDQYNKAKEKKEKAQAKVIKKSGGKTVFVGDEVGGVNVSVDRINEKNRLQDIAIAEKDMAEAVKDLAKLGVKEADLLPSQKNVKSSEKEETPQAGSVGVGGDVEPIRQLGTGANVYFETDGYRVNDGKDGKTYLIIRDENDKTGFPLNTIEFDNVTEAVFVANKISEIRPDGLTNEYNIDKIVDSFKEEYKQSLKEAPKPKGKATIIIEEKPKEPLIPKQKLEKIKEKVKSDPNVLLRTGKIEGKNTGFFAIPEQGGPFVDDSFNDLGVNEETSAYTMPNDFKVKDLSNMVFDDYKKNKEDEKARAEGYDGVKIMEMDGTTVMDVVNPKKLIKLDESLPELRNEKLQEASSKTRKAEGGQSTKQSSQPTEKKPRKRGRSINVQAAMNVQLPNNKEAAVMQTILENPLSEDILQSIFGGPDTQAKSGRKSIKGERSARISMLKKNGVKSVGKMAELAASKLAEWDGSPDAMPNDFSDGLEDLVIDTILNYNSKESIAKDLLAMANLEQQQFDEQWYAGQQNEDLVRESEGIVDALTDEEFVELLGLEDEGVAEFLDNWNEERAESEKSPEQKEAEKIVSEAKQKVSDAEKALKQASNAVGQSLNVPLGEKTPLGLTVQRGNADAQRKVKEAETALELAKSDLGKAESQLDKLKGKKTSQLEIDTKPNPLTPFQTKDKEGQAARAALKESVGPKEFKRLENIAKNGEKILRDLESRQILKIDCP